MGNSKRNLILAGVVVASFVVINAVERVWISSNGSEKTISEPDASSSDAGTLSDFSRLRLSGAYDLTILQGDYDVSITSDRGTEGIKAYVKDETLFVKMAQYYRRDTPEVKLVVHMPELFGLTIAGAVQGDIKGVAGKRLDVEISGAGALAFEGPCGTLELHLYGAGDLDAETLKCKQVRVSLSGAGLAKVYASESVFASIPAAGRVVVFGNPPTVNKHVPGMGQLIVQQE